jgi:hypothetical protein
MSDEPRYVPIDDMPPDDGESAQPASRKPTPPHRPPARPTPGSTRAAPATPPPSPKTEPPSPHRVRLVMPFSPGLLDRVKTLRTNAGVAGEPPNALILTEPIEITDEPALHALLAPDQRDLPLTVTLTRVEALVHDSQTYVAGWVIDDADKLNEIHADLIGALKAEDIIEDEGAFETEFDPLVLVGESVPAKAFPALIAAMQRDFTPFTWRIESIIARPEPAATNPTDGS